MGIGGAGMVRTALLAACSFSSFFTNGVLRGVEAAGADHGFMCEARSSFDPQASAQGWRLLLGEGPVV